VGLLEGLSLALTNIVAIGFTVDIVILLVAKIQRTPHRWLSHLGQNQTVELVGSGVPECSNCQEPRAGGVFSDDGGVYLCPKCLAFHDEYMRIMASIDRDQRAIGDQDADGDRTRD
jgi:hypothetical protein